MRSLIHAANILAAGRPMVVGYIGGSITEHGGSSGNDGWRRKVTNGLAKRYPQSNIVEVCAALSGTGSDLAACRADSDLLQDKVDLVFIEFSVNDMQYDEPIRRDITQRGFEGLIRKIITRCPQADIVIINTVTRDMSESFYDKGVLPWSVYDELRISRQYDLPVINVGRALRNSIRSDAESWESLTQDYCHPTERGHDLYAEMILMELECNLLLPGLPAEQRNLPEPLYEHPLIHGKVIAPDSMEYSSGWQAGQHLENDHTYRLICSNKPGEWVKTVFCGTAVGVLWVVTGDSGNIDWCIDDGEWINASVWDKDEYVFTWPQRVNYKFLATHLPDGEHCLQIRISHGKYVKSSDHWIRLIGVICG